MQHQANLKALDAGLASLGEELDSFISVLVNSGLAIERLANRSLDHVTWTTQLRAGAPSQTVSLREVWAKAS